MLTNFLEMPLQSPFPSFSSPIKNFLCSSSVHATPIYMLLYIVHTYIGLIKFEGAAINTNSILIVGKGIVIPYFGKIVMENFSELVANSPFKATIPFGYSDSSP